MLTYPNETGGTIAGAHEVDGRKFSRRLKRTSACQRAFLAADLKSGALRLHGLTTAQATSLAKVSASYVATVERASEEERGQLQRGSLSLSTLHKRRCRRPLSDADIERIIVDVGAERIMHVLDKLTEPYLPALVAAE